MSDHCTSTIPRRYGSARCDLASGHDGEHVQHGTDIHWTDQRAAEAWARHEDEA